MKPLWIAFTSVTLASALAHAQQTISLDEAIHRAQTANGAYAAAATDAGAAQAQRTLARSALLPGVVYHNQYLYTQGQGGLPANSSVATPVRFVANNAVHEYISQAAVTETIGGAGIFNLRRADADAAAAKARLEIARRGLVLAVVNTYFGVLASTSKVEVAQRALDEAARFGVITRQRETAGEAALADTVRADIQLQQRQRDLNEAKLAAERSRLDLGVFLFPDPTTQYQLSASLLDLPALPARTDVDAQAQAHNPDLKAAMESLRAADFDVKAARFGYLPDLSVSYFYGIDAPQFAVHGPDGARNLGYSTVATLDIPVWDWFATHARVRQSSLRRDLARVELSAAQRQLIASLQETYREAEVSREQLALLDKSVASSTEALRLTTLRYTAGEGTVLEVVDAQSTLVSAESSRADGAARYFTALATLQTLTGIMP